MPSDPYSKNRWTLYVLQTLDNSYYTGITTDLERRLREHFSLGNKASKFLKAHPPKNLVFSFGLQDRSLALKTEYHFKKLSRKNKEKIIRHKTMTLDPSTGKIRPDSPPGQEDWKQKLTPHKR